MSLDVSDCVLSGPALTEPFLRNGFTVAPGVEAGWESVRRAVCRGGEQRVHRQLTTVLAKAFGYNRLKRQAAVLTREGQEDGGWLMQAGSLRLRVWSAGSGADLDSMDRTSLTRSAQRVLFAQGERAGLQTNGGIVRLLLCDPERADSCLSIPTDSWPKLDLAPDSFRVLATLAGARTLHRLPQILDAARLHRTGVTTSLRGQARDAICLFINALPNRAGADAQVLWRECLILVYRLLFILKLECASEPGAGFSFASTRLWRSALSPTHALAPLVRRHLDAGHDTGRMLECGLRALFAAFQDGLSCSELRIAPLGGALFGADTTPVLDRLDWGDRAVALLLDRLMWTGVRARERVHYGSLDVEELGSIYEGLLELQPVIASDDPIASEVQEAAVAPGGAKPGAKPSGEAGAFFLRTGSGRKASGSYYTPNEFVRFLVRETLETKVAALSSADDPRPAALLSLRIVDPAMGSGHFLVEACRYLGEALLSACLEADARGLHERIAALPDPDNTIASYLPSRGYNEVRARGHCRRLVAVHCLYGCDRNELAVALAKLSLWLESWAEGLPLTFLDHRLVRGDALAGPFFEHLATLPVSGGPLDPLLAQGVAHRLEERMGEARLLAGQLNASIGRDVGDIGQKHALKQRLDELLLPLRMLAAAWAEAAARRGRDDDDLWLRLASSVTQTGGLPLDCKSEALSWDLMFPEVFPDGFSAVLGNPPWDTVQPNKKDFAASYHRRVLDARTAWERAALEKQVLALPGVANAWADYQTGFARTKHIANRLYALHHATNGNLDLFRLFAERALRLAAGDGAIGMLMPSAFHVNEGTHRLRLSYLQQTQIAWCLSFENRKRIFDIDSRFKFDAVVAHKPGPTGSLRCGFYLERVSDVTDADRVVIYDRAFLVASGGEILTPLELRSKADLRVAQRIYAQPDRLGAWCAEQNIRLGRDLHMTGDASHFLPPGAGDLIVHEGKTFHQYTGSWQTTPRYSVRSSDIRPAIAEASGYPRLAFRDIARSTDDRTMIAFLAPAGTVFGHTATVEKAPWARRLDDALLLCGVFNSFTFDWIVRQKAATHLSLYLLNDLPLPSLSARQERLIAAAAGRLSSGSPKRGDRAWIDAVVALAYGLDRAGYEHILGSFAHRMDADLPALCLRTFERLSCAV